MRPGSDICLKFFSHLAHEYHMNSVQDFRRLDSDRSMGDMSTGRNGNDSMLKDKRHCNELSNMEQKQTFNFLPFES